MCSRVRFIQQRQRLLRDLVKLTGLRGGAGGVISLARFCDELIDYLSWGHFSVYSECAAAHTQTAAIATTTSAIMAFAERYGDLRDPFWAQARRDLDALALTLETRFELEDDLLAEPLAAVG